MTIRKENNELGGNWNMLLLHSILNNLGILNARASVTFYRLPLSIVPITMFRSLFVRDASWKSSVFQYLFNSLRVVCTLRTVPAHRRRTIHYHTWSLHGRLSAGWQYIPFLFVFTHMPKYNLWVRGDPGIECSWIWSSCCTMLVGIGF